MIIYYDIYKRQYKKKKISSFSKDTIKFIFLFFFFSFLDIKQKKQKVIKTENIKVELKTYGCQGGCKLK